MAPAYRIDASAHRSPRVWVPMPPAMWQGGTVVPGGYAPVIVTTREKGRHLVPRQWVSRRLPAANTWSRSWQPG
jgi:hypothetical protein